MGGVPFPAIIVASADVQVIPKTTSFRDFSNTIAQYPKSDIVGFHTSGDLSLFSCLVWTKGDVVKAGEVQIKEVIKEVEVEVIKEVIKEVPFDNPELLEQIQTLQDALSDALNAEEAAKKEADDLKKQIPK